MRTNLKQRDKDLSENLGFHPGPSFPGTLVKDRSFAPKALSVWPATMRVPPVPEKEFINRKVSSFLTKILLIDWRLGERYFATKLVDYDPANNNGGWQWSSGTGADSQPYFRIFNPFLQSQNHDPNCKYIKRWIPELAEVPNEIIHDWNDLKKRREINSNYPSPIVDYTEQKEKALKMYKEVY